MLDFQDVDCLVVRERQSSSWHSAEKSLQNHCNPEGDSQTIDKNHITYKCSDIMEWVKYAWVNEDRVVFDPILGWDQMPK